MQKEILMWYSGEFGCAGMSMHISKDPLRKLPFMKLQKALQTTFCPLSFIIMQISKIIINSISLKYSG